MVYKEIHNFLPEEDFKKIKDFLSGEYMYWCYNKEQTYSNEHQPSDASFFTHGIFRYGKIVTTPYIYKLIEPILKKIKPRKILRIKANLVINRRIQSACNFHIDDDQVKHKAAIYYINTNNGFTLLDPIKRKEVKCEENKLLIFDGKILHSAVAQTDTDQRLVINFNYQK